MNERRPHPHLTVMATPAPAVRLVKPHERAHARRRYRHRLEALYGRLRRAEEQFYWGCVCGVCIALVIGIVLH